MEVLVTEQQVLAIKNENDKLRMENNILKQDIGYWKSQHKNAIEREDALKKDLQDKKGRIKYLVRQLYEKKTEQQKKKQNQMTLRIKQENGNGGINQVNHHQKGGIRVTWKRK